jgi:hypothetical protein
VQGADADFNILKERLGLGERGAQQAAIIKERQQRDLDRVAAARDTNARLATAEAQRVAEQAARDRELAEYRNRDKYTFDPNLYTVPDPNDPTKTVTGRYRKGADGELTFVPTPGAVQVTKPGSGRGGQSVYETRITDLMSATGLPRNDVVLRLNQKGLTAEQWDKDVAVETARLGPLGKPNTTGKYQPWPSDDELRNQAEANVRKRVAGSLKATGTPPPLTGSAPSLVNSPYPAKVAPTAAPVVPAPAFNHATPPAPQPSAPQPAPPAAQRVPGTVYQTPKGPLTWTGTGWR